MAEEVPGPAWLDDESVGIIVGTDGRNLPYRVTLDGGATPMIAPDRQIAAAGLDVAAGRAAISAAVDGLAGEVWMIEERGLRQVTREGSAWQRRFPMVELTELSLDGPGGPIQAWLASPADAGRRRAADGAAHPRRPDRSVGTGRDDRRDRRSAPPAIRVLMPNIRGSTTYGSGWIEALGGAWGDVDAADAMAVVDAAGRARASPIRSGWA